MSRDREGSKVKTGCGCSSFVLVLVIGLICTMFGVGIGGGASVRIPFTDANASVGGAIGKKELVQTALPDYLRYRIASNSDFINHTGTLTIWLAEGIDMVVIGAQPEAPAIDLNITVTRTAEES